MGPRAGKGGGCSSGKGAATKARKHEKEHPLISCRISVFWAEDSKYYRGTVTHQALDANGQQCYHLQYDDGDTEDVCLEKERFVWHGPRGASHMVPYIPQMRLVMCVLRAENVRDQEAIPEDFAPNGVVPVPAGGRPSDADAVGWRIKVWWAGTTEWVESEVLSFRKRDSRHHIVYADGEVEWLVLDQETVWWVANTRERGNRLAPIAYGLAGEAAPKGREAVKWYVGVYNRQKMEFRRGEIVEFDGATGKHRVQYLGNDGGAREEWISLTASKLVWRFPPGHLARGSQPPTPTGSEAEGGEGVGSEGLGSEGGAAAMSSGSDGPAALGRADARPAGQGPGSASTADESQRPLGPAKRGRGGRKAKAPGPAQQQDPEPAPAGAAAAPAEAALSPSGTQNAKVRKTVAAAVSAAAAAEPALPLPSPSKPGKAGATRSALAQQQQKQQAVAVKTEVEVAGRLSAAPDVPASTAGGPAKLPISPMELSPASARLASLCPSASAASAGTSPALALPTAALPSPQLQTGAVPAAATGAAASLAGGEAQRTPPAPHAAVAAASVAARKRRVSGSGGPKGGPRGSKSQRIAPSRQTPVPPPTFNGVTAAQAPAQHRYTADCAAGLASGDGPPHHEPFFGSVGRLSADNMLKRPLDFGGSLQALSAATDARAVFLRAAIDFLDGALQTNATGPSALTPPTQAPCGTPRECDSPPQRATGFAAPASRPTPLSLPTPPHSASGADTQCAAACRSPFVSSTPNSLAQPPACRASTSGRPSATGAAPPATARPAATSSAVKAAGRAAASDSHAGTTQVVNAIQRPPASAPPASRGPVVMVACSVPAVMPPHASKPAVAAAGPVVRGRCPVSAAQQWATQAAASAAVLAAKAAASASTDLSAPTTATNGSSVTGEAALSQALHSQCMVAAAAAAAAAARGSAGPAAGPPVIGSRVSNSGASTDKFSHDVPSPPSHNSPDHKFADRASVCGSAPAVQLQIWQQRTAAAAAAAAAAASHLATTTLPLSSVSLTQPPLRAAVPTLALPTVAIPRGSAVGATAATVGRPPAAGAAPAAGQRETAAACQCGGCGEAFAHRPAGNVAAGGAALVCTCPASVQRTKLHAGDVPIGAAGPSKACEGDASGGKGAAAPDKRGERVNGVTNTNNNSPRKWTNSQCAWVGLKGGSPGSGAGGETACG